MRKLSVLVFLIMVVAMITLTASADSLQVNEQIQHYLASEPLQDYSISSYIARAGSSPYYSFVLLQNPSGNNLLYVFTEGSDGWEYAFKTSQAVPQGKGRTYIVAEDEDTIIIAQEDGIQDDWVRAATYAMRYPYQWYLTEYFDHIRKMHVTVSESGITYYGGEDDNQKKGRVQGTIQTDMRYVNLGNIPSKLTDAQKKYTVAPYIPAGTLKAQKIKFTGGKKYPVYSGPGEDYYRSAMGRAAVSTNDWIQVFGRENGWIMIQYAIDSLTYRIGYITENALPKSAKVDALNFQGQTVYLDCPAYLTDDPLFAQNTLATLAQGTKVTLLGTMDEWAYIEVKVESKFRGFVPLDNIRTEESPFETYISENGDVYDWFTVSKMYFGDDHKVTHVSGYYERLTVDDECEESEKAQGSDITYKLADDFHADMLNSMSSSEMALVPVTDLYQWYIDAYYEGQSIDHDWIFTADLTDEQLDSIEPDFWFVTTQIELNDKGEIQYMKYVIVPWG